MATKRQQPSTTTANGKTIYLNNRELLAEVTRSKKKGIMSDQLARMLQMLCTRYAKKGNFVGYTYNEDMQAYAMMMLVRTWNSFDPEKSNNPFAFFTQCIKNSFIQYLNQEKRQRNIRDLLLVDQGMTPSFNFTDGVTRIGSSDGDEEDFEAAAAAAAKLAAIQKIEAVGEADLMDEEDKSDSNDDKPSDLLTY